MRQKKQLLAIIFFSFLCFVWTQAHGDFLDVHKQALVVDVPDWNLSEGTLNCYERYDSDSPWKQVGTPVCVVIGHKGLAWGRGIFPQESLMGGRIKCEGDGKSPAGIFLLGPAFGFEEEKKMTHLRVPYFQITPSLEAVDDPESKYYNQIVDRKLIKDPDWKTSEKMIDINEYELGIIIHHNYPDPIHGMGSAIFMHIWNEEGNTGTAGCTAMDKKDLEKILLWLDASKFPIIIQGIGLSNLSSNQ